jgi:carbon-monoxide dehydrogenase medium subunit
MLKKLTRFYHPKTIEEACLNLGNKEQKTALIAGGTSEVLRNDNNIEALVDLSKVKELCYIKQSPTSIHIGAATPVQDIYKSNDLKGPSGELLKAAAGKIGSTLLRNSITAAGNLAGLFPWSDLPPVYMVLDAEVVCRKGKPKRTVPVQRLIETRADKFLTESEIIAELMIPVYGKGTGVHFAKFAKTSNDYAMISLAVRMTQKSGVIEQARVAVNAITALPTRCSEVEKFLEGKKGNADLFAEAAKKATIGLSIRRDFRASNDYRKEVLEVMVRRGLQEAFDKAKK